MAWIHWLVPPPPNFFKGTVSERSTRTRLTHSLSVFPDWVAASLETSNGTGAFAWWTDEMVRWSQNVSFDGIWIDMSEVSSFCVGSCGSNNVTLNPVHPPFLLPGEPGFVIYDYPEGFNLTNATEAAVASSLSVSQVSSVSATAAPSSTTTYFRSTPTPGVRNVNYPPYVINNAQGDLAVHAVSPNATHHGGALEYDFHNVFGHQILNATHQALLAVAPEKRPFIIGRSTLAGSGKWAGHWGGDNYSLWAFMYFAIGQALSFSIFGIPMFGVDTCGFSGNSDMELCNRWMQVSAFFPFYRNHNTLTAASQEPYLWESVAEASRDAMAIRYSLLPYIYTTFAQAHETGSTVMRAMAWEFPGEPWLADADRQFLLGPAVLVTPVLAQGATTVDGVFPGTGDGVTVWYDWYNRTAVTGVARGQNVTLDAPLGHIPVHIRGGSVVPTQEAALTTRDSRASPWGLLVALDLTGAAEGTLYLDDGVSVTPNATTWVAVSTFFLNSLADPLYVLLFYVTPCLLQCLQDPTYTDLFFLYSCPPQTLRSPHSPQAPTRTPTPSPTSRCWASPAACRTWRSTGRPSAAGGRGTARPRSSASRASTT